MSDPDVPESAAEGSWAERNYRGLKIAVIVMGMILVAGFVLVIVTILSRLADPSPSPAPSPIASAFSGEVSRLLGPDGEVVSTALDGNRMAIVLKRPEGHAIVVIDLRSGEVSNIVAAE